MLLYERIDLLRYGVQEKMEKQPDNVSEGSKEGGHDGKQQSPTSLLWRNSLENCLFQFCWMTPTFLSKASRVETVSWSSLKMLFTRLKRFQSRWLCKPVMLSTGSIRLKVSKAIPGLRCTGFHSKGLKLQHKSIVLQGFKMTPRSFQMIQSSSLANFGAILEILGASSARWNTAGDFQHPQDDSQLPEAKDAIVHLQDLGILGSLWETRSSFCFEKPLRSRSQSTELGPAANRQGSSTWCIALHILHALFLNPGQGGQCTAEKQNVEVGWRRRNLRVTFKSLIVGDIFTKKSFHGWK